MKNILFYESRPEWGGAQKCEYDLILHLHKSKLQTFFVTSSDGPLAGRLREAGKQVYVMPVHLAVDSIRKEEAASLSLLNNLLFLLLLIPHFIRTALFIWKNKIDVVYTSQFRSQLLIGWLGKLLGKKVVWHIHGEEALDNFPGKIAVRFADQIIVVSNNLNQTYQRLFPNSSGKFQTLHNGVNAYSLEKKQFVSSTLKLIMIGTLVPGKRQDLAIEACAKLVQKGYRVELALLGEKPPWHKNSYKTKLEQLTTDLNVTEQVKFHGWVENPASYIQSSDILVLPSDTEGLPLSIIEAMSAGVPCIATKVGGIPELIENNVTGFLIEKNAGEELATAIQKLADDPLLREQMGIKGQKRYQAHFTKEKFIKGVSNILYSM